jgi:hypothetical protein
MENIRTRLKAETYVMRLNIQKNNIYNFLIFIKEEPKILRLNTIKP